MDERNEAQHCTNISKNRPERVSKNHAGKGSKTDSDPTRFGNRP